MKKLKLILSLISVFFILALPSFADDYFVDSIKGLNTNSGTNLDSPWKTITHAISQAFGTQNNPAVIYVEVGIYNMALGETFPLTMKHDIQLIGKNSETTIIDATGSGTSVIFSESSDNVVIDSFVIKGGEGSLNPNDNHCGGGIYCFKTSMKIKNCSIINNKAGYGGGIYCYESSPEITDCIIENNTYTLNNEGLGGNGGGILCENTNGQISDCLIKNNKACWGGGISLSFGSNMSVSNCSFQNNIAEKKIGTSGAGGGGGVYLGNKSSSVIRDCDFKENSAFCGGIYVIDSTLNISNSLFKGNIADWGSGLGINTSVAEISKCSFVENLSNYSGGGLYSNGESSISMNRANFVDNEAKWGGGIYSTESSNITIQNSQFNGNMSLEKDGTGGTGGFIDCEDNSILKIINCLLTNNNAYGSGGAVYHERGGKSDIINCTFVANSASYGPAVHTDLTSSSTIKNSILWDNGSDPLSGKVTVTFSVIEGSFDGDGNINQDPLFTSGPYGDFYLSQTVCGQSMDSPCINAGTNISPEDFNHKDYITRTDGVVDTGSIDMGFHYIPHAFFGLGVTPISFGYKDGDEVTLRLDLTTAPIELTADIYLIMLDPDGKFYSAMVWNKGLQPLAQSFNLPANLDITTAPLFTFKIPSTTPPVDKSGSYTFYLAALKPGTVDFLSNIASTGFTVQ